MAGVAVSCLYQQEPHPDPGSPCYWGVGAGGGSAQHFQKIIKVVIFIFSSRLKENTHVMETPGLRRTSRSREPAISAKSSTGGHKSSSVPKRTCQGQDDSWLLTPV